MVASSPVWSSWTQTLPTRPLAANLFADGVYRRPREEALRYQHVEFNNVNRIGWLLFDQDTDDSFECWQRSNLPAPNFYSQNGSNGHGCLGYCLREPIGLSGDSRREPIKLLADVQRGMTRRLGADWAFANRLGKNPANERWRSSWYAPEPYGLGELLEALDRKDLMPPPTRAQLTGVSRNLDLFDALRQHAYANVRAFNGRGSSAWLAHLLGEAQAINHAFAIPLSFGEVAQTAKSVARWTWKNFSNERFSAIQARFGARGGVKSGERRAVRASLAAVAALRLATDAAAAPPASPIS